MGVEPGAVSASAMRAIDEPMTRAIWTAESRSTRPMATIDWKMRTASMSMSVKAGSSSSTSRKPERPPEPLGHVERDVGALGHLGLGQPVPGRDQHPVDHQQVEDVVLDGPVDLLVGAAEVEEQEAHPGQRLDPGDVVDGSSGSDWSVAARAHPRRDTPGGVRTTGCLHWPVADPGVHRPTRTSAWARGPSSCPIKAFHEAKRRLDHALTAPERSSLARSMAARVLEAARPAAGRRRVRRQRRGRLGPGTRCPGGVGAGPRAERRRRGRRRPPARRRRRPGHRLPRRPAAGEPDSPTSGRAPGITLVPDRYGNGTNVIALPADAGFHFSYGPGSFARHRAEAERLGLPLQVLDLPDLAWDVDEPGDMVPVAVRGHRLAVTRHRPSTRTRRRSARCPASRPGTCSTP